MKSIHLILAMTLGLSGLAFAAGGHEHKPLHGGIVTEVRDMDYELVAKPEQIQLFVRDHDKPVNISKGSAKLTVLSGNQKQEISLLPDGDRFLAKGTFAITPGTKAVAQVSLDGSAVTARFVLK
ncbi:hypothetical protein [Methyloversatilis sp.]|uniref:hypothetical protein n=1 Tax=Methyloversatilis sp. TaxID=2569862 RepID=UPI00273319B4|nr:hypothetical protein [Methyloversatilis sp.]MDD2885948.1 hypothetical protein [Dechloromonas sp.]MDP3456648.1 hypothetical protein [Methyloversatilis sp.]